MKPTTLNWIPNVVPGNTGSSALLSMLSPTDYGEWHASIFFNNGWGSG